jgi:hypothetical protein
VPITFVPLASCNTHKRSTDESPFPRVDTMIEGYHYRMGCCTHSQSALHLKASPLPQCLQVYSLIYWLTHRPRNLVQESQCHESMARDIPVVLTKQIQEIRRLIFENQRFCPLKYCMLIVITHENDFPKNNTLLVRIVEVI